MSEADNFIINVDFEINPWIKNYKNKMDNYQLNNLLKIGYEVLNNLKLIDDNKFLDAKIEHINELNKKERELFQINTKNSISTIEDKLQQVCSKIEDNNQNTTQFIQSTNDKTVNVLMDIVGKTNISAHKGQIGENFIQNTLISAYPDAIIESKVSDAHAGDVSFKNKDYPFIMIESKNYSSPVPSKEVIKFKNDLVNKDCKFGIFLSFNQKINNVHDKIYIESYNDITILYASCIEFNKADIVFPIEFIHYLSKYKNNYNINSHDLTRKAEQIYVTIDDLKNLQNLYRVNLTNIQKQEEAIVVALKNIQTSLIENQINCDNLIKEIQDKISVQIFEFLDKDVTFNEFNLDNVEVLKNRETLTLVKNTLPEFLRLQMLNDDFVITGDNNKLLAKLVLNKKTIKCNIIESNCSMIIDGLNILTLIKYLSI